MTLPRTSLVLRQVVLQQQQRRCLSSKRKQELFLPRITERRQNEAGPGGHASNAGVKVAIFGASGFLGRYLCSELGKLPNNSYLSSLETLVD
jgi:NADH dehydrogenase (ubiquinone) 1 alpha subcomplex subunit 9